MTTHWYSCDRCLEAEGRTISTQAILMDSKSQEPTSQPRLVSGGYLLPSVWQLFHLISPNLWSKAESAGEKIQPWEWDKVLLVVGTLLQMCPQGTLTYTILVFTNKMQQSVKSHSSNILSDDFLWTTFLNTKHITIFSELNSIDKFNFPTGPAAGDRVWVLEAGLGAEGGGGGDDHQPGGAGQEEVRAVLAGDRGRHVRADWGHDGGWECPGPLHCQVWCHGKIIMTSRSTLLFPPDLCQYTLNSNNNIC